MNGNQAFWFFAGVLSTAAVVFVVYPLLRRNPANAQPELRQRRWIAVAGALGLAVIGAAIALYGELGTPEIMTQGRGQPALAVTTGATAVEQHAGGSIDGAVVKLERRLALGGGTDDDWDLLAKTYTTLGRPADAAAARQKRLPSGSAIRVAGMDSSRMDGAQAGGAELQPAAPRPVAVSADARVLLDAAAAAQSKHDFPAARAAYLKLIARNEMTADAWADYADVAGTLNGNSLQGEPEQDLRNALRLDPQNAKALWLLGSLQHDTKQYAAAVDSWRKLLPVLGSSNSEDARLVAANLAQDQQLAGGDMQAIARYVQTTSVRSASVATAATSAVHVSGEVVLDAALHDRVPSGLTLFIVAKSVSSPGPPVAIFRTTTKDWPLRFQLDDTNSMLPDRKLSTAGPVTIEARTSRSGNAMPESGDFLGVSSQFDPTAGTPIRVVIQRVIG